MTRVSRKTWMAGALLTTLAAVASAVCTGGAAGTVEPQPETGTVTDIDGNTYSTVKIGNQWWMAENLRVQHDPAGNPIQSFAYSNDDELAATYGRLYTWDVTMNGSSQAGSRGIAPDGWHIPSDADWDALFSFLGGASMAGGALKEAGTDHWSSPNTGATNSSGFAGLPAGARNPGGAFDGLRVALHMWSSTPRGTDASLFTLHRDYASVLRLVESKAIAASVRCVKD